MVMHAAVSRFASLFPFLTWPRLDAALLRREGLAGMPLVTGIYAALVALLSTPR